MIIKLLIGLLVISFGIQISTDNLDCKKELLSRSQHTNLVHLLTNLGSLWVIGSRLEDAVGSQKFLEGVFFLWISETIMDSLVPEAIDGCGVGFSGIILGLSVWELTLFGMDNSKVSLILAALITVQGIHYGHLYGVLSGLIWSKLNNPDSSFGRS